MLLARGNIRLPDKRFKSSERSGSRVEPFFTERALLHLGGILTGDLEGRGAEDDVTVYCSTGLAGSEVVIAEALLANVEP